jgi:AraC-like DNA-binding protein
MPTSVPRRALAGWPDPWEEWDDIAMPTVGTMRTVRVRTPRGMPATYGIVPAPGELPVWVWPLGALVGSDRPREEHSHEFPGLVYFDGADGTVTLGGRTEQVRAGDLYVIAPGDVIGRHTPSLRSPPHGSFGWGVMFTPDALGAEVPGAYLAWRTHPLLFPFVRGSGSGPLRLPVPEPERPALRDRVLALERELTDRPEGYREAARAHLVLLLVAVSRLAADLVGDLRADREPLLAAVFEVIEARYADALSLRDVARAVSVSPGHLTTTVRRRTGRTVQEWITERRMVQARRLLVGSGLSVAEVGRRVGYPDAGYFARVFGRAHGVSPARWRQAGR